MFLQSNTLKLRALEPPDLNLLYEWENNPEVWRVSSTIAPYSKLVLEEYMANAHLDIYSTKQLRLMIDLLPGEETGSPKTIGCIDLFDFDFFHLRAGVGILIADMKDRRKGYASEALRLIIDYCFEHLNLHQVFSTVTVDNEASAMLFKYHQFEITGIKKQWIRHKEIWMDELMMQLIRKRAGTKAN